MQKIIAGLLGLVLVGGGCVGQKPAPAPVAEQKQQVTYVNTLGKYSIKHPQLFLHDKATDAAAANATTEVVVVLNQDQNKPYDKKSKPLLIIQHLRTSYYPETQMINVRRDYLPNNKNVKVESVTINGHSMWQMLNTAPTIAPGQNQRVLLWGDMVIVEPASDPLADQIIQTIDYVK